MKAAQGIDSTRILLDGASQAICSKWPQGGKYILKTQWPLKRRECCRSYVTRRDSRQTPPDWDPVERDDSISFHLYSWAHIQISLPLSLACVSHIPFLGIDGRTFTSLALACHLPEDGFLSSTGENTFSLASVCQ